MLIFVTISLILLVHINYKDKLWKEEYLNIATREGEIGIIKYTRVLYML